MVLQVHLLPTMNPDGYENTNLLGHSPTRGNANGVDLNRAFPTWRDLGKDRGQLMEGRQKEVNTHIYNFRNLLDTMLQKQSLKLPILRCQQ